MEQVTQAREVPLERLEADICEGAALLAALTLAKDLLRDQRSAERRDEKRSAEGFCELEDRYRREVEARAEGARRS